MFSLMDFGIYGYRFIRYYQSSFSAATGEAGTYARNRYQVWAFSCILTAVHS